MFKYKPQKQVYFSQTIFKYKLETLLRNENTYFDTKTNARIV